MKQSLFRKLTNKALSGIDISGSVLDIGGEKGASYHKLFRGEFVITTLNISASACPDIVFDVEKTPLPIEDNQYNAVLLINLLEHVCHYKNLVNECLRILKPGGKMVIVVPFLYYIHPSPNDYFRYTRQSLERLLKECGFVDIEIIEIGMGAFSAAYNLLHRFFPSFVNVFLERIAVCIDRAAAGIAKRCDKKYTGKEYPLGYLVQAKKQPKVIFNSPTYL